MTMRAERRAPAARAEVIRQQSSGKRAIEQGRARLICVVVFFVLSFSAISFRLLDVAGQGKPQASAFAAITNGDSEETEKADLARLVKEPDMLRGDIVDRNGMLLATSLSTASLFANPKIMSNPAEAAKKLGSIFPEIGVKALAAKLDPAKSFVWIKRNLTPREQQRVNTLGIPGLNFQTEERRIYPQGNILCHVLGYVGVDNRGLAGIEQYFDKRLKNAGENREPLRLSIDLKLQNIVHAEIARGMEEFRAIGATGIVMDIKSGEILAMANLPDFDPHRPASASQDQRFNRASLGTYEMGSTFKTFTAAMALDYGVTTIDDGYDASHPIKVANFTISDAHPQARWLSVPEIYAYSSNIGTVKMALDVGTARQKAFLEKLGFMKPVEIELPERGKPQYPEPWREISTMTISYGHGMTVTPLHLVRGIASIAGPGTLEKLTLLKDGNLASPAGSRMVSEQTAKQIRRLMRLVVLHGTGSKADVAGYRVGGKTGTAEKVQGKSYNANAKMALFVSAFPVDAPKYVMLVMMDEPQPTKATFGFATGGWNAAPVAARIIARMGPMVGMHPEFGVAADDAELLWKRTPGAAAEARKVAAAKTPLPMPGNPNGPRSFDEILHAIKY